MDQAVVKLNRPAVSTNEIEIGIKHLVDKLMYRLQTKGNLSFASRHEILGIITEEYKELIDAVQVNGEVGHKDSKRELLDVGVAALFGYICMNSGHIEW